MDILLKNFPNKIASSKHPEPHVAPKIKTKFPFLETPFDLPPVDHAGAIFLEPKEGTNANEDDNDEEEEYLDDDIDLANVKEISPRDLNYLESIRQRLDELAACIHAWFLAPRSLENPHIETYESETHFRNALRWAEIIQRALTTTIPAHPELFDNARHQEDFYDTVREHLRYLIDLLGALVKMRRAWAWFSRREKEIYKDVDQFDVFKHPVTGEEVPPWTTWLRSRLIPAGEQVLALADTIPKIFEMAERGFVPTMFQTVPTPGVLIVEHIRGELEKMAEEVMKETSDTRALEKPILQNGGVFTETENILPDGKTIIVTTKGRAIPGYWKYYTRNDDDPTTEMARLAAYLGPEDDITTRFDKSVVYRLIFKKTPKQAAEVVEKLRQKAAERKRREAAGLPPSP